ncbi:MAG: putative coat protein [Etongtovirus faecivicinum]|uniref:Coat protein n=1 Tax=Leviviridae sp. TaxID=2027243 RepID=A0ABY3SS13_9VIRU|nr:MAG: putative coat protein [Leviviridae sp.]
MPQLTTVVLKDRAASPADHTFTPANIANGVGKLVETSGVPVGNSTLTVSNRQTANGRFRVEVRLAVPVVQNQDIGGIISPIVVRTSYADCTFTFDKTSTLQERKDTVGMFYSALGVDQSMIMAVLQDLEGVY